MMFTIEPCPYCDNKPNLCTIGSMSVLSVKGSHIPIPDKRQHYVICNHRESNKIVCASAPRKLHDTREDAIRYWNMWAQFVRNEQYIKEE